MDLALPRFDKKINFRWMVMTILSLIVFLTDNSRMTTASSFEGPVNKKHKYRLPANIAKPVIDLDCAAKDNKLELTTHFETLRVEGRNCGQALQVENVSLKNKLITFPVDNKTIFSEFTHLAPGENKFVIVSGKQTFNFSIFRY